MSLEDCIIGLCIRVDSMMACLYKPPQAQRYSSEDVTLA